MKNLKLISFRIDCDTLAAIDKITRESGIKKRSWVINNLLKACVDCSTPQTLHRLATEFDPLDKGYTIKYGISKSKLLNPHHYEDEFFK